MIERVVLRERLDGPGFSFENCCLREVWSRYGGAEPMEAMEEVPHGVRVTKNKTTFTIPWASIRFTQGPVDGAPEEGKKTTPTKGARP